MGKTLLIIIFLFLSFNLFSQEVGEVNLCLTFNQSTGNTTGQGTNFDTGDITWYFITFSSFDQNKRNFKFDAFRFILYKEEKHFFDSRFSGVKGYPCVYGDINLSPGNYWIIILAEKENIILGKSEHFVINKTTK